MKEHPILTKISSAGMRLGIDRFQSFLEYIGNPTANFAAIHVAGTNGKGSVVRTLEYALVEGQYRVGAYTSPHLREINERIHINTQPIDDVVFSDLIFEVYELALQWAKESLQLDEESPLTHFELLTACAFVYFARS